MALLSRTTSDRFPVKDLSLTTTFREYAHLAIMFADISGSTRLYERLGDSKAKKIVDRALGFLTDVVQRHKGVIVKKIGDELMCTFDDPHWAADASTEMHGALQQASLAGSFGEEVLGIRVGFHFGMVIKDRGDVFGDAVNVAARVVAQAKRNQILTTRETLALLPAAVHGTTRFVDRFAVKGKSAELEIFELVWDTAGLTMVPDIVLDRGRRSIRMRLRFRDKEYDLCDSCPAIKLGRGDDNDIVVPDSQSSRMHAKVELRREKVFLVDQSMNGTYVAMTGDEEVFLRHEEIHLKGTGIITLGRPTNSAPDLRITFSLEEPTADAS